VLIRFAFNAFSVGAMASPRPNATREMVVPCLRSKKLVLLFPWDIHMIRLLVCMIAPKIHPGGIISDRKIIDISVGKGTRKIVFSELPNIQIQKTGAAVKVYAGISTRFRS
jgi:hypothetical protein